MVVGLLFFALPVKASAPIGYIPALLETKDEMVAYAKEKALKEGVDESVVLTVIGCESHWNPSARGDHGHSRGLAQIHALYHPDVSDKEADNPKFAIDFLVEHLAAGDGALWTCFRRIYGS